MQAEEIKLTGADSGVTLEKKNVGAGAGKNQGVITVAENNPGTATIKNEDDEIKVSAKFKNNSKDAGTTESSESDTTEATTKEVSDTTTDTSEPAPEQTSPASPTNSITAPKNISPTQKTDKPSPQADMAETEIPTENSQPPEITETKPIENNQSPQKTETKPEANKKPDTNQTPNTEKEAAANPPPPSTEPAEAAPSNPDQTSRPSTENKPEETGDNSKDNSADNTDNSSEDNSDKKDESTPKESPSGETGPKEADSPQTPPTDEATAPNNQSDALEAMPTNANKELSAGEQVGAASEIAKSQNHNRTKSNSPDTTNSPREPNPAEAASASPKTVDAPQVAQDDSGRPIEDKGSVTPPKASKRIQQKIASNSAKERQKRIKALQKEKKELELVIKEFEKEAGDILKTPPFKFIFSFSAPIMLAKMMLGLVTKSILEKIKNGKGKAKLAILKSAIFLLTILKNNLTLLKKSAAIAEALRNWTKMVTGTVVETLGLSLIVLIPLLPIYLIFAVFFDLGKMPQNIKKVIKKVDNLLNKFKKAAKTEERKINTKAKLRQITNELKILAKEGNTRQPTP